MTARDITRATPIDLIVIIDTLPVGSGCLDFPVKLLHKQLTAGLGLVSLMGQEAP
jgi:hypothetical protein